MIRVLIVDDQSLVRAGFRMILEAEEDVEVVGEAADGAEALAAVPEVEPDVILMDVRMPNVDGLEATRRLLEGKEQGPRVLILTTFDLDEYVYEALRVGASGFLLKDTPPEQLVEAIRVVSNGDALLSPVITRRVIEEFVRRPPESVRKPARELELTIANDGRGDGAGTGGGQGLDGMRERVSLYGGEIASGPREGGGYVVHARLPIGEAAS